MFQANIIIIYNFKGEKRFQILHCLYWYSSVWYRKCYTLNATFYCKKVTFSNLLPVQIYSFKKKKSIIIKKKKKKKKKIAYPRRRCVLSCELFISRS